MATEDDGSHKLYRWECFCVESLRILFILQMNRCEWFECCLWVWDMRWDVCCITLQKSSGWVESAWSRGRSILHFLGGLLALLPDNGATHLPISPVLAIWCRFVHPVWLFVHAMGYLALFLSSWWCFESPCRMENWRHASRCSCLSRSISIWYLIRIGGVVPDGNDWERILDPPCRPYSFLISGWRFAWLPTW